MDTTTEPTFGGLLRRYRLVAGLTQEELAERAGVSPRAISDLERGQRNRPWRETVQLLATALRLEPTERAELTAAARRSSPPSPDLVGRGANADSPAPRHNLPVQVTSFVGREGELAEVKRLLAETRLLTLTGSGGCGKTRLALHAAADLLEAYPDGSWLVDLSPLSDPALVPQTVAQVLTIRETPGRPLLSTLVDALNSRHLLIVLDNAEHLLDACACLADALLRACPHLCILATSREVLRVSGEAVFRVPSLAVPPAATSLAPGELAGFDAVRLFLDRAKTAESGLTLTPTTAPAVAEICRRLDGIPLALELAAARTRALPVDQIAAHLDQRFRLLTRGSRAAMPRQQTLAAMVGWSYDLLTAPERTLFDRLAVFAGGFDLEAAERVCGHAPLDSEDVLDCLTGLVEKSLVLADRGEGGVHRYGVLETLRQYGWERLVEAGDVEVLRGWHARFYLALAERAEPITRGPDARTALHLLDTEHDNLGAALEWCQRHDASAGLRLSASLWYFWIRRGHLAEGGRWLAAMLDRASDNEPARAPALLGSGVLARDRGDHRAATSYLEESLRLYRATGDRRGVGWALMWLGLQSQDDGDYRRAKALLEESLAIRREVADRSAGFVLGFLGKLAWLEGDAAGARRCAEEMLGHFQADRNPLGLAVAFQDLGELARSEGDYSTARDHLSDALARRREIGDPRGIAYALWSLGDLARLEDDSARAEVLLGEALGIFRALGARETGSALAGLGDLARLRGNLGDAAAHLRESLAILAAAGQRRDLCRSVGLLGLVAAEQGAPGRAICLLAAATANAPGGMPLDAAERRAYDDGLAATRAALGEEAFAAAWAQGRAMTLEQAVAYALEEARC